MPTLAVARLRDVRMGPSLVEYLQRIDATLAPFVGHFLVHGGPIETLEGGWSGDLIILAFPDRASALGWYHSPAYQAIVPLRTASSDAEIFLIDTVAATHRATDILPGVGRASPAV